MMRFRMTAVVAAVAALLCTAAGAAAQAGSQDAALITRDELVATGKPTLHEALRSARTNWVRYRESARRFPTVYVDSVPAADPNVLQLLKPEEVQWVQYSTATEASRRFEGVNPAGVIHVSTRLPLSAAHPATVRGPGIE
ncbi:MAG: hypothetical protein ICV87_04970, partial [Gemmatimonadetes bacterium]|nr:hypothetical protein [Gemmatimonadota bacterium]